MQPQCLLNRKMSITAAPQDQAGARQLSIEGRQLRKGALVAGAHLGDEPSHLDLTERGPEIVSQRRKKSSAARQKRRYGTAKDDSGKMPKRKTIEAEVPQQADLPR